MAYYPWAYVAMHTIEQMAFERVFTRVLRKLPATDAIALASQREKVIQLLHKELSAEGVLVEKEGEGSARKLGGPASSDSVGTEPLAGSALSIL